MLNVELISGLQVFGPADSSGLTPVINTDTTVVFYVDPNDENLSREIQQSSNRYNYLRIPLTLGYEFTLKRASFEVNAGVEYTRLIRANGISYKDGLLDGKSEYFSRRGNKIGETNYKENKKHGDMIKINVDRSKYDVKYGSSSFFDNLGDKVIYDIFELEVKLILN